jgi:hypothetical protein
VGGRRRQSRAAGGGHGDRRADDDLRGYQFRCRRLEHRTPPDWVDRVQLRRSELGDRRRLAGELTGYAACWRRGEHAMNSRVPALPRE